MEEEAKDGCTHSRLIGNGRGHDLAHYGGKVGACCGVEGGGELCMATPCNERQEKDREEKRRGGHD